MNYRFWKAAASTSAAALVALVPVAAQAQTYALSTAFNGTASSASGPNFRLGFTSAGTFGGVLTSFDSFMTSGCRGDAAIACALTSVDPEVAVYKAVINGGTYDQPGSAFYEAGELNFHPGTGNQNAGFQFGTLGSFDYLINLSSNDTSGARSTDYRLFQGTTLLQSGIFNATPVSLAGAAQISANNALTLLIGSNGDFRFDSTGVSATFTSSNVVGAVPEPATWGMMLVGFGIMGAAMRYRRKRISVLFATN